MEFLLSQSFLVWIVVSTTLYIVYGIVYRLYLSPIASFPGPKLAALTFGYEFYYNIINRGQYIWKIKELHEIYGPILRVNLYELHILDSEFYDKLYSNDRQANKWEWQAKQFGVPGSIYATVDHETHRLRRGVLNQFFSMQRARQLQPVVQERVDALVERFAQYKDTGRIIQLENAFAALANGSIQRYLADNLRQDVVMEYNFSRHDHRIEAPDFDPSYFKMDHEGATMTPLWRYFYPVLRFMLSLPDFIARLVGPPLSTLAVLKQRFFKQIEDIRSGSNPSHDTASHPTIFHDILSSKLPDHEKSSHRLKDEAQLLIGAGTGTTSWTMALATFHLLENPSILRKSKDELKTVDPDGQGHAPVATLQTLPYLTAIINECLRFSYGATHRLQRIFPYPLTYEPSQKGQKSWVIPPGTPTSMTIVHLHHDENIFPDSHTFKPERWIDDPGLIKYQMAFSKGSRRCIGINLAYAELYTCIASVFAKFGCKEVKGEKDIGTLELVGTTVEHVKLWGDCFIPVQKPGSLGVRATVTS